MWFATCPKRHIYTLRDTHFIKSGLSHKGKRQVLSFTKKHSNFLLFKSVSKTHHSFNLQQAWPFYTVVSHYRHRLEQPFSFISYSPQSSLFPKNCLQVIHSPSLSQSFAKKGTFQVSSKQYTFFSFNRVLSFYYLLSLYYQSFVTISFSHLMFQFIILPQNH